MINKLLVVVIIIVVIVFIGFLISSLEVTEHEEETSEYVSLAEEWIREYSETFKERGGTNLEHVRTVEIREGVFEITFTFDSSFAGYGVVDEDEMVAQVITPHTIVLTVEDGVIVDVIVDGVFDETSQEYVEEEASKEKKTEIGLYFIVVEDGKEGLVSLKRELSVEDIEREALVQLLLGLSEEEKSQGYSTAINEGVGINDFRIEEEIAYVDFTKEIEVGGGSALVSMIREQIEKTLLQFDTIKGVEISIEGETEDILQP
jgi:hypothetical protein